MRGSHDDKKGKKYFQEILDVTRFSYLALISDHYLVQIILCFY
jgi:hypothetical protein